MSTQNQKLEVLCGDMEFGDFSVNGDNPSPICIIHRIHTVLHVEPDFDFDSLLDEYGDYVVPSQFGQNNIFYHKNFISNQS